jgi:hypothetical protein
LTLKKLPRLREAAMAALHRAVLREGLRVRAPAGLRWPALWLLPGAGSGPDGEVAGAGEDGHVEADFGDDGGGGAPGEAGAVQPVKVRPGKGVAPAW